MAANGLDILRKRVPGLQSAWGFWRFPLAIALVFALTSLFFVAADTGFPEWMPDGEIVILTIGFLLLSRFFSQRDVYRRKYGELAYRMAFTRFNVSGLGIIAASIGHLAYISGPQIPPVWWQLWLVALGWLYLLIGVTLWLRAAPALGADNLAMLYVYHPEDSRLVQSRVYGVVRHPIYSAALDIGFGLALIHASWYALLVALLLPIFFAGWIRLIEEPELIRRLPSYADYRRAVPAFWPRLNHLPTFFRYLLLGDL